jgi:hypothetical protein
VSWKLKIGLVPLFGESVVGGCRRGIVREIGEKMCAERAGWGVRGSAVS